MAAWAKFPNQWVVEGHALPKLRWGELRTTALGVVLIMIALAVRLNLSHRTREREHHVLDAPNKKVRATLDELGDLTGLARATIVKAIGWLRDNGAIAITKEGRANVYELIGIDTDGKYCQLPQEHLMNGSSTALKRLVSMPRTRISFLAAKIYVLLLVRRNQRFNTTSISYDKLSSAAGVRREEIHQALGHLTALELVGLSDDVDARQEVDKSRRYKIIGLKHHA